MNKEILKSFISKYYLKSIESVRWIIKDNKLIVKIINSSMDLIGEIILNDFNFKENEIAIFDNKTLLGLINILSDSIEINIQKDKLIITDDKYSMSYPLANLFLVKNTEEIIDWSSINIPQWDCTINLTSEIINDIIKAQRSLSKNTSLVIDSQIELTEKNTCLFIFGNDSQFENQITYKIPINEHLVFDNPLKFNPENIKNILDSNKDTNNGIIKISTKGLINFVFKTENITSNYFLLPKQDDDY
jgi:hypothetical protein